MFGMGMNEVMIVLAIAVIVIGPKQLPQVARAMGKMVAQFKRATNDLRNTITDEVKEHVPMDEFNEMRDTLHSGVQGLQDHSRSLMHDEFEDDKKIGAEVADDLTAVYSEIPTEADFGPGNGGDPQPRKRRMAKGGKKTTAATDSSKLAVNNKLAAGSKTPAKKTASAKRSGKSNGMGRGAAAKGAVTNTAAKTAAKSAGKRAANSRQGGRA